MRTNGCVAVSILLSLAILPGRASGQADSLAAAIGEVHTHILHISDAFEAAPGGQGLLRIALAEGEIAALHADLAAQAVNSSSDVRLHVRHMLHAIDPSLALQGPGLGYGLERATEEALLHLEMATTSPAASDNVRTHALHISTTLGNTLRRTEAIVALARDLDLASGSSAASLLARLTEEGLGLVRGRDIDSDGLVGWQTGEGGLRQAHQHLTLLKRGEGLLPRQ
jgi:hypothetical protein